MGDELRTSTPSMPGGAHWPSSTGGQRGPRLRSRGERVGVRVDRDLTPVESPVIVRQRSVIGAGWRSNGRRAPRRRTRRRGRRTWPRLLGPDQRLGRRDAAEDLEDAALEDPVLGPGRPGVLDARHLDPGHVARRAEASDPVAVGVAGEVADDRGPAGDHVDQPLGVVGVDAEVALGRSLESGSPRVVVARTRARAVGRGGQRVEPLEWSPSPAAGPTRRPTCRAGRARAPGSVDRLERHRPKCAVVVDSWLPRTCGAVAERRLVGGEERSYSASVPSV